MAFFLLLSPALQASEAEIRKLLTAYEEQFAAEPEAEDLQPLLAKDFSALNGLTEKLNSPAELAAFIKRAKKDTGEYTVKYAIDKITLYPKFAVVVGDGLHNLLMKEGGRKMTVHSVFNVICVRDDEKSTHWKILRFQESLDPVRNPFFEERIAGLENVAGGPYVIGAIVTGLLAGIFIGKVLLRSRA